MFSMQPRSPKHDRLRAASLDVRAFLLRHRGGDLAVLDGKAAAEAATGFALFHLDEPESRHFREELPRLRLHADLPQARARIVIGHGAVEARRTGCALRHLGQKFGEARRFAPLDPVPSKAGPASFSNTSGKCVRIIPVQEPEGTTT